MSQIRVYLPLSLESLRVLATSGVLGPAPIAAYAVTEQVERAHPGGDEEEWEWLALCDAADAAGRLRSRAGSRRVVAAADVDSGAVGFPRGDQVGSRVDVVEPVPLWRIASLHIDEGADQARAVVDQADQRDGGGEEKPDLLWYDITELDEVLRALGT